MQPEPPIQPAFLDLQGFSATILNLDNQDASREQIQGHLDDPRLRAEVDENHDDPKDFLMEACLIHVAKYRDDFELLDQARTLLGDPVTAIGCIIEIMAEMPQYHGSLLALVELIREDKVTIISENRIIEEIGRHLCFCQNQEDRERSLVFDWFCEEITRLATLAAIDEWDPVCVDAAILLRSISVQATIHNNIAGIQWLAGLLPGSPDQYSFLGTPEHERMIIPGRYSVRFAVEKNQWGMTRTNGFCWLIQSGYRFAGPESKLLLQNAIDQEDHLTVSVLMDQWRADPWFDLCDLKVGTKSKEDWRGIIPCPTEIDQSCQKIHNDPRGTICSIIREGGPEAVAAALERYTTTADHRGCYCLGRDQPPVHVEPIDIYDPELLFISASRILSAEDQEQLIRVLQEYMIKHDLPVQYRYANGIIMIIHSLSLTRWQMHLYPLIWGMNKYQATWVTVDNVTICCVPLDFQGLISQETAEMECGRIFKVAKSARSAIVDLE